LLCLLIGIIWAYRLRRRPSETFKNHARWMIRTFWISSLFFMLAIVVWIAVFASNADQSAINPMLDGMKAGTASPEDIRNAMITFEAANRNLLIWSTIGCFILPIIHATVRFVKGYRAADGGRLIANVTTWWL
jgi:uncharacterized membrane protein